MKHLTSFAVCIAVVSTVYDDKSAASAFLTPGTHNTRVSASSYSSLKFRPSIVNVPTIPQPSSSYSPSYSSATALSLRRKLLSEDDMAEPPNQKVIETIEKLLNNNNDQIIASDVASKTGVSLSETKKSLSSLATLTRGDISVTKDGELVYSFPEVSSGNKSIQSILSSNSLRYKLQSTWTNDVWPKLFWGIRISFGVFLFVSIAAIFSTLIFIQSGGSSDDRDDDRRGNSGGGGMFRYGFGDFLFDIFYPRPYLYSSNYYGYYGQNDPYYINNGNVDGNNNQNEEEERGGIFEGIFSYIFGDGNPNRNLEAARLREASRVIRMNGGAVTAEQLAPFCDVDDPDNIMSEDFNISDEGFVLPIVSQLGGEPTVTDDGDIVYLFKDLQISAMDDDGDDDELLYSNLMARVTKSSGEGLPANNKMEYLQEMNVDFNRNEGIGNILAGGLGVVNLFGALYLGQVLASPAMTGVQLAGVFGVVQTAYPLLVIYAILFNAIPAARYVYNQKVNTEISKRNSARRKWLTYLQVGGNKISRKLQAAKRLRQRMKRLGGKDDMVFDTRTDIEDLEAEKQASEMKKFDDLLGGGGGKDNNGGGAFQ
jgi:hypothetical protein